MRRDFGSRLMDLIDANLDANGVTAIYAAVNEAIAIWEPRVEVVRTRMDTEGFKQGVVNLIITLRVDGEVIEQNFTIAPTPETPLEPSTPIAPETDFNVYLFGNDNVFTFGDQVFGWSDV